MRFTKLFILTLLTFLISPIILPARQKEQKPAVDSLPVVAARHFARGNFNLARETYSEMLSRDENSVQAMDGLAAVALATRDWSEAASRSEHALKINPSDTEAHYLLAQADREKGRRRVFFLRWIDFRPAREHFSWVLSRDSLYKDIVYQFALFQLYDGNSEGALSLAQDQIRLKPDFREAKVDLFKIYRRFLATQPDDASRWFTNHPSDYNRYFLAEWDRRNGRLKEAEHTFLELRRESQTVPLQLPCLSLAKIKAQEGKSGEVEQFVTEAIDGITHPGDADLVFESFKYLVTNEEMLEYRSLNLVNEQREFFRAFWMKRNPNPGAAVNARLLEHYRRLVYAETWYEYYGVRLPITGPDIGHILDFPESYYLNEEFNDKGVVFLRHGEPDKMEHASAGTEGETWIYYATNQIPDIVVDFAVGEHASGQDWRLTPYPAAMDVFHPRRFRQRYEIEEEARATVTEALSTDRYEGRKADKYVDLPVSFVSFRGRNGNTIVEFSYPLPFQELSQYIGDSLQTLQIRSDLSYLNNAWKVLAENHSSKSYGSFRASAMTMIELARCILPPDSYSVYWEAKPLRTNLQIDKRMRMYVRNYSGSSLNMSDVELAFEIGAPKPGSEFNKGSLLVVPNPLRQYATERPLYLYFEAYNLSKDQKGRTSYTIEYELKCLNPKRSWLMRLFSGGKKSSIAFRSAREGTEDWSPEHIALDIHELEAGEYQVGVKVTDEFKKTSVLRTEKLTIYEQE